MTEQPTPGPVDEAIKALVKAQQEMGAVLKNAKNSHLKSKYADLGSVIDATFPALHANGFAVMQPAGMDNIGQFVETHFCHISGKTFSSRIYLVIGKNDMQGVGSAHTYARRYGLMAMAGVAPEDDDGEATKAPKRQDALPPFDNAAFTERLLRSILSAKTLQNLKDYFAEAHKEKQRLTNEQYQALMTAKDERKAALAPPVDEGE
jgi:hypothetical protein